MKRLIRKSWKLVTILTLVAAAGGLGFRQYQKKPKKPKLDLTIVALTQGEMSLRFTELGDIAAKDSVNIASKVSGRIIELPVHEGQAVRAGQTLAVIQPGRTESERFLPSTVTAPIDGVLIRYIKNPEASSADARFAEIGDYVTGIFESQSPTYLMTIADMRRVVVKLKINEMDILKLREGMSVLVKVDALPGAEFPSTVSMISPQAEKDNRGGKVFRVEVSLGRNDPRLRTGMTARVDATLEHRAHALKMPLAALFDEGGASVAYLQAPPGGKPKQTLVKTGMRTETDVEVLQGLKDGEKVLTEKPEAFDPAPPEALKAAAGKKGKEGGRALRRKAQQVRRAMTAI
ncbi:MAG: hypothetical protein A2X36_13025 [Elusimicrobia bacterium GWA2_69_24]|nr:MAG: hypothetical protein A2X36_13025 [Elusimicrobia bacterium GWA2_69_24]